MTLWIFLGFLTLSLLWWAFRDRKDAVLTLTFPEGTQNVNLVTTCTGALKLVLEVNGRCYTARTWPWSSPQGVARKLARAIQRGEDRQLRCVQT